MHPYMIEKLAAAHRDDLLSSADRHRQTAQARLNRTRASSKGAGVTAVIASAVARVLRATVKRLRRLAARQQSSGRVRPAPW